MTPYQTLENRMGSDLDIRQYLKNLRCWMRMFHCEKSVNCELKVGNRRMVLIAVNYSGTI